MTSRSPGIRRTFVPWFAAVFFLTFSTVLLYASSETATSNQQSPRWVKNLPATSCPWSSTDTDCHHASPALADITGDGKQEIIVGTNNGYVVVYRFDGTILWQKDIGPALGMDPGSQQIASSPAVADIDKDGEMEVVVGAGTIHGSVCTQGGVITLEHDGSIKSGWPFLTQDDATDPSGCRDSVYSSPALGDLDNDGDLEIVFGSFDKRVYAVHHDGQLVTGFPPDSYHFARFGWDNLAGRLADTIWSSPALTDIDNDGYLDIVIGTDEGNFDNSWPAPPGNWSCPYRVAPTQGYCGGSIYAFDRNGRILDGFPRYKHETIQSTPAVMNMNSDGQAKIFVGTGSYYYRTSPDKPALGFRVFGMDSQGNDLPGWEGGKVVGGVVTASPSLGDITGDGQLDIVVAAQDKRLYAWHRNGQLVSGFPMSPRTHLDQVIDPYGIGTNFILADYTGDGKMEIFLRHAWEIVIVDGTGQQLTGRYPSDSQPVYLSNGPLWNNPAVSDIDNDGHLELIVQNSQLMVWRLPNASQEADWPMFKQNASRSSLTSNEFMFAPDSMQIVHKAGQTKDYVQRLKLVSNSGSSDWTLNTNNTSAISFSKKSGTINGETMIDVLIKVKSDIPAGPHDLGIIYLTIMNSGKVDTETEIPIKVVVFNNLNQNFLPYVP